MTPSAFPAKQVHEPATHMSNWPTDFQSLESSMLRCSGRVCEQTGERKEDPLQRNNDDYYHYWSKYLALPSPI